MSIRSLGDRRSVALRLFSSGYVGVLILIPMAGLVIATFQHGLTAVWRALVDPAAVSAFRLTLEVSAYTVAINAVFGVLIALAVARDRFIFRDLVNVAIDMPLAVSPVIAGYMLLLLFGQHGMARPLLDTVGVKIVYALPGMVIATLFVSLPFVAREVIPVLQEAGTDAEDAAVTLGAGPWTVFWRVTFPTIRWGLLSGMTLTLARSLGEFGAVLVVGGGIIGETATATQFVNEQYIAFKMTSALAVSLTLALVTLLTLGTSEIFRHRMQQQIADR